jgi:hypothetical protein
MLGETVAEALLLDKVTDTPPAPAAADSVMVPVALCPAVTLAGLIEILPIVPVPGAPLVGVIVSVPLIELLEVAVIVANIAEATGVVATEKLCWV